MFPLWPEMGHIMPDLDPRWAASELKTGLGVGLAKPDCFVFPRCFSLLNFGISKNSGPDPRCFFFRFWGGYLGSFDILPPPPSLRPGFVSGAVKWEIYIERLSSVN